MELYNEGMSVETEEILTRTRKTVLIVKMIKQWNGPREAVESVSLDMFRTGLDMTPSNLM